MDIELRNDRIPRIPFDRQFLDMKPHISIIQHHGSDFVLVSLYDGSYSHKFAFACKYCDMYMYNNNIILFSSHIRMHMAGCITPQLYTKQQPVLCVDIK